MAISATRAPAKRAGIAATAGLLPLLLRRMLLLLLLLRLMLLRMLCAPLAQLAQTR
jgi:hypothetical protein